MSRLSLTPDQRRALLVVLRASFYRCPNTGTILTDFGDSDDKILCGCGMTNPRCPVEARGLHVKHFLSRATLDDYLRQDEMHRRYVTDPHAPDPRD